MGERVIADRARQLGAEGMVDGTLQLVLERPDVLDPERATRSSSRSPPRAATTPKRRAAYADAASSMFWYLARNLDRDLAVALTHTAGS